MTELQSNTFRLCRHSLGSALATLAAVMVESDQYNQYTVDGVYTFGSPRVGDATWSSIYNQLGLSANTLRFVYYQDPVPLLPPTETGYVHVGRPVYISEGGTTCTENDSQDEWPVCGSELSTIVDNGLCVVGEALTSPVGRIYCMHTYIGSLII